MRGSHSRRWWCLSAEHPSVRRIQQCISGRSKLGVSGARNGCLQCREPFKLEGRMCLPCFTLIVSTRGSRGRVAPGSWCRDNAGERASLWPSCAGPLSYISYSTAATLISDTRPLPFKKIPSSILFHRLSDALVFPSFPHPRIRTCTHASQCPFGLALHHIPGQNYHSLAGSVLIFIPPSVLSSLHSCKMVRNTLSSSLTLNLLVKAPYSSSIMGTKGRDVPRVVCCAIPIASAAGKVLVITSRKRQDLWVCAYFPTPLPFFVHCGTHVPATRVSCCWHSCSRQFCCLHS